MSQLDPNEIASEEVKAWRNDPMAFIGTMWPDLTLTKQQSKVIDAITEGKRKVSIRSGHGPGKSTILSLIALWFISTHPGALIPITAPSWSQLFDVLWGSIIEWWRKMPSQYKDLFEATSERFWRKGYKESWFIAPRTARPENPDSLQGYHSENLMFLVDEAAGIHENVYQVAMSSLTQENNWVILAGNPTATSGFFFDSHHKNKDQWQTFHFPSTESEIVDKQYIKTMRDTYGEDSNIYRVRVEGNFPDASDLQLIPTSVIEGAVKRTFEKSVYFRMPKIIGVDVARFGSDQSVIIRKQGVVASNIKRFRNIDLMKLVGLVSLEIKNWKPDAVFIDETGIGSGVIDRLYQLGFDVVTGVNFGSKAGDERLYSNKRAEMWSKMAQWLKTGSIPDDDQLALDLRGPQYSFDSKNRILIEKKDDMRKRGLQSPDIADALCLCFSQDIIRKRDWPHMPDVKFHGTEKYDPLSYDSDASWKDFE